MVADWPGYFPEGPAAVRLLIEASADPNAVVTDGTQAETPLHWAASSDDADVAEALISGGADPDATPGYSDQTAAQIAAEPGTQRQNLITWLHDRSQ